MFKKRLLVIGLFLSFVESGLSEEVKKDTLRLYYLDEVVVTATRMERAVKDISIRQDMGAI
ncbi:MAG: hypothetical protein QMD71_08025 [bacterium]|nr:hypothetical protein [bacterium]